MTAPTALALDLAESAVERAPGVARYQHQLGATCARKAVTGTFTAIRLAGRIEHAFERAVALEPGWIEAHQSLLGFRLIAPRLPRPQGLAGARAHRARRRPDGGRAGAPPPAPRAAPGRPRRDAGTDVADAFKASEAAYATAVSLAEPPVASPPQKAELASTGPAAKPAVRSTRPKVKRRPPAARTPAAG